MRFRGLVNCRGRYLSNRNFRETSAQSPTHRFESWEALLKADSSYASYTLLWGEKKEIEDTGHETRLRRVLPVFVRVSQPLEAVQQKMKHLESADAVSVVNRQVSESVCETLQNWFGRARPVIRSGAYLWTGRSLPNILQKVPSTCRKIPNNGYCRRLSLVTIILPPPRSASGPTGCRPVAVFP